MKPLIHNWHNTSEKSWQLTSKQRIFLFLFYIALFLHTNALYHHFTRKLGKEISSYQESNYVMWNYIQNKQGVQSFHLKAHLKMNSWLTCFISYARRTNLKSGETEYLDALKVT